MPPEAEQGGARAPGSGSRLPAEVLAFHRESAVFDLHVDTLLWTRLLGYDLTRRHRNLLPRAAFFSHMDLPRAAEGGLDGAVMGLVVNPSRVEPELIAPLKWLARLEKGRGFAQTLATLALLEDAARRHPERLVFARSGSEARRAIAAGRFAALAGLEGAHGIEDDMDHVRVAYQRGLRLIGLVHFQRSSAAWPMTATQFDDRGLTPFGFDLISEMESLGMLVDLAHLNRTGLHDALAVLKRPFVVSHGACAALEPSARNLSDAEIHAVAERGGVVGIAAGRDFLGRRGLEGFLDHVDHALDVAGADAVALGSDWDGAIVPAEGMRDVRCLPFVTAGLLERGRAPEVVRKFLGENALRVLTEVCG